MLSTDIHNHETPFEPRKIEVFRVHNKARGSKTPGFELCERAAGLLLVASQTSLDVLQAGADVVVLKVGFNLPTGVDDRGMVFAAKLGAYLWVGCSGDLLA